MPAINCKTHSSDFILYCIECNCFICVQCLVASHQKHEVKSVSNISSFFDGTDSAAAAASPSTTSAPSQSQSTPSTQPANTQSPPASVTPPAVASPHPLKPKGIIYLDNVLPKNKISILDVEYGNVHDQIGETALFHFDTYAPPILDKNKNKIYKFGGKYQGRSESCEVYDLTTKKSTIYPLGKVRGIYISGAYDGERYIYITNNEESANIDMKIGGFGMDPRFEMAFAEMMFGEQSADTTIERFDTHTGKIEKFGNMECKLNTSTIMVWTKYKGHEALFIFNNDTIQVLEFDSKNPSTKNKAKTIARLAHPNTTGFYDGENSIYFFSNDQIHVYNFIKNSFTTRSDYDFKGIPIEYCKVSHSFIILDESYHGVKKFDVKTGTLSSISEYRGDKSETIKETIRRFSPIGVLETV